MKKISCFLSLLVLGCCLPLVSQAQAAPASGPLTLEQCIGYALANRPALRQSLLDEEIGEREIRAGLAGWLPQVSAQYNLQHYLKMPVTLFPNDEGKLTPRTIGTANSSTLSLQLSQALFNNDVVLAHKASRHVRSRNDQATALTKINTVVAVSKAFYDILLTQEQLRILEEAILRQQKQQQDAQAQYQQGLVDKTDYQRASITLSNTRSDRRRAQEAIKAKTAYLKELMGLAADKSLMLAFDRQKMEQSVGADTTQQLSYANRVEYRQLETAKAIQALNIGYYRYGFLPSVSAFGNYNLVYQNQSFNNLYNQSFPNSLIGLSLGMPIFQGTRRLQNLRRAQLVDRRLDLDVEDLKNQINTEYQQALASYKSDLQEWTVSRSNVGMAQDVYRILKLQYDEGIRTYLDLITAETDLRTTELNYYNSLYRVLASKLDLQRAQGQIPVQ
ncbi:MAG: TolC family protein [Adhaeribacter sp.]